MISPVPFSLDRLNDIALQPQQRRDHFDLEAVVNGPVWTFVDDDGHCVACGGLYQASEFVAVAWAFIGADSGPVMPALFLKARKILRENRHRWPVIRSGALEDFEAGNRLLALLGFTPLGITVSQGTRVYNVAELPQRGH